MRKQTGRREKTKNKKKRPTVEKQYREKKRGKKKKITPDAKWYKQKVSNSN